MIENLKINELLKELKKEVEKLELKNKELTGKISTLEGELEFTRNKVHVIRGRGCN